MKTLMKVSIIVSLLTALTACGSTQPIRNVEQAPVAYSLTKEQVNQAIVQAALSRGWLVEENNSSEVVASITVRTHQAKVRIPYSENSYSIQYESSTNLKHRGDVIHRNYNRWVHNLDTDIRRNMSIIAIQ